MAFVDGTNLFYRLDAVKLNLNISLWSILNHYLAGRQIVRIYLYTIEEHRKRAEGFHKTFITDNIRMVYGEGIPLKDGNVREKGVDALLVADLVYHAAVKNFDYALVVSTDTDFVRAVRRVEDFGCRTGVLSVCSSLPNRLREACDDAMELSENTMITNNWAARRT